MVHNPKPNISDGVITALAVAVIGAPEVFGPHIPHAIGVAMFWGGIGAAVLYAAWRWGAWALGLLHGEHPPVDNRGGIYIGGNSEGSPTIVHSNADPALQEQLQGMITGGDSYCYLMLAYFDLEKNIAKNIGVLRLGKYPLYDVRMRIVDMHTNEEWQIPVGEISGGGTARAVWLPGHWPMKESVYYRIFFSARNGLWHQDYLLGKCAKREYWASCTRVIWTDGTIIREDISEDYIEKFGNPKWSG